MSKLIAALMIGFFAAVSAGQAATEAAVPEIGSEAGVPASEQLEQELQNLDWKQFKAVISAIPKLKADVDAYGPMGWQYVQANYKTYRWRKSINKLDATQKVQLAELIQKSKSGKGSLN
jgi:hypothetical protein